MELLAKHPEIQENLSNLNTILEEENLSYIPIYSNAMSSMKSQRQIKDTLDSIKYLKDNINQTK